MNRIALLLVAAATALLVTDSADAGLLSRLRCKKSKSHCCKPAVGPC